MTDKQARRTRSARLWTAAHAACVVSILAAAIIAVLVYSKFSTSGGPEDNAGWSVFEFGFEFQRLLLAAEKGESLEEIRFRGEIYLSRVLILRDAPLLADTRAIMQEENLTMLFRSAQETERLIAGIGRPGGRDALLSQLRADARMIRELTLALLKLDRRLDWEQRKRQDHGMLMYLGALEFFMIALLVMSGLVFRTTRQLQLAGRKLARQVATQGAILQSVDTAILGLCPAGSILYSNPSAVALFGPGAQSGGRLTGQDGLAADIASLIAEMPEGQAAQVSRKIRPEHASGPRHYVIHVTATGHVIADEAAEDHCHIVAVTDVTEEEEAARRREEYDAQLGEASRLLAFAAMSGGIVHEISQPLAAIRNYAYALKVSLGLRPENAEHQLMAARLGEEADRAIEFVRTVRRMGPQEAQEGGVCDLREAIEQSIRLVTLGMAPPPPIAVDAGAEGVRVAGSLTMIGQVVVNLLKNALSASAAAGHSGAEISVSLRGSHAEIAVADFGGGVPDDAARTMFAPFVRSARGGMGLGLAICQRIAANLGGSLSWRNGEQAGAVFTFTIPLATEGAPA